ncbi:unnamed protein product [Cyclocybe aegerita]|uniref:Aminoglycoside phosphotransferase domain-containing protein n=1 Tax=Cyclocybe aegerita TaxID=1973307 RepID=A0A8S0XN55_CYCAE|nr:unnamed protein product [Cyclocybe aegerita]
MGTTMVLILKHYSINEQELFSVTTKRWLYNDDKQRAIRHVPFNVQAFIGMAVQAADARTCTSLKKIQDGTMNRVFSLKLDNGVDLIAKIPFPVAGPKHFCTASEVATLDYLRSEHGIPVPNVRAWCSKADSTPVRAEYILYDRIPGVPLHDHNGTEVPILKDPYVQVLPAVRRIESRLASTHFSQIGSIYYKEDIPDSLRDRPLGPWSNVHSYMFALAACARASINKFCTDLSLQEAYHDVVTDYETLVPHIAPQDSQYILWHPDLHASNIIVTEMTDSCTLRGVIDWQGARVAPYYTQLDPPPAFTAEEHPLVDSSKDDGPELSVQLDTLTDPEQQRLARLALRRAWRAHLHRILMRNDDPELAHDLYEPMGVMAKLIRTRPATLITRGLEEGLDLIRHSFLMSRGLWGLAVGVDGGRVPLMPFPLHISDEEEKRITDELTQRRHEASAADEVLERLGVPLDGEGIVDVQDYEKGKHEIEDARQALLDKTFSQEEKDRLVKTWPLQNGKVSLTAETCH